MAHIKVNGKEYTLDLEDDTPLLWAIRDEIGLKGTKFGCGKGLCGACTVHMNGSPIRSCSVSVTAVMGADITTIEGISEDGSHPVQKAWIENQVPQCGYCQPGQIMSAVSLLQQSTSPSDEEIAASMSGNICRCGTYKRIVKAIKHVAHQSKGK